MDVAGQYDGAAACPQTLPDLLDDLASRYPGKTALEASGGRAPLTYGQLAAYTGRVGQQLCKLGVCPGDRVALVLENGPEIPAAFLGVTSAATCGPLNPAYSAPEFEFYLTDLRAKALIVGEGMRSASIDVARSLGIQVIVLKPDP